MDLKITLTPFEGLFVTTGLMDLYNILSSDSSNLVYCHVIQFLLDKIEEVIPDEAKK